MAFLYIASFDNEQQLDNWNLIPIYNINKNQLDELLEKEKVESRTNSQEFAIISNGKFITSNEELLPNINNDRFSIEEFVKKSKSGRSVIVDILSAVDIVNHVFKDANIEPYHMSLDSKGNCILDCKYNDIFIQKDKQTNYELQDGCVVFRGFVKKGIEVDGKYEEDFGIYLEQDLNKLAEFIAEELNVALPFDSRLPIEINEEDLIQDYEQILFDAKHINITTYEEDNRPNGVNGKNMKEASSSCSKIKQTTPYF